VEKVEVRSLVKGDIGEALRLKSQAGWNQTEGDWRRLLKLDPQGCFAASVDGQIVGTTTTTMYGRGLAWVGMVLVDQGFRRRGIATKLMRAALRHLDEMGVTTVKLDATPAGAPVYEALGFETELLIERWSGVACGGTDVPDEVVEAAEPSLFFELDRRAFGADRTPLLKALFEDASDRPLACMTPGVGRLIGYVFTRPGTDAFYVGPLVATDPAAASKLLEAALCRLTGRRVFIDLNTTFVGGGEVLASRGFVRQRELIRMRYGEVSGAGTSGSIFSIAGPEYG